MTDRIFVRDLQVFARHGVEAEEATLGQRFVLDLTAHLDLTVAGQHDVYAATVGYDALITTAMGAFTARRFALIEAAAEAVAASVLKSFPAVQRIEVVIRKPAAPIDAIFGTVGVAIERSRG